MNVINSIQKKLETARKELLDLGLNNRLINHRPLKARGVEVVNGSPPDVYRILVQDRKAMSFRPRLEPTDNNKLQTDYSFEELERRLFKTEDIAKKSIGEQGVNTLYLALGMLQWYESESSDIQRHAPLILIPVEISRTNVHARFHIRYTEEEIGTNLSLLEKLKSEFSIQLPSIPERDDSEQLNVQSYCEKVEAKIRDMPRWTVNTSAIALGFFSFTKFLMYHDLDTTIWLGDSLSQHSVLQSLLNSGFEEPKSSIDPSTPNIDEHLNPAETHHVVDADSSQALAIHDVSQGRNLVIQGPPGTGKSQTITNLIADAIAKGKRVLFVAEKMAALEVVKRKLDEVGLGDACLELHSHKTNKKAVVDELKRTCDLEPQITTPEQELESLCNNRERLNRYCEVVNTPIGESGVTPYQAYGELLTVKRRLSGMKLPTLDPHQFQHSGPEFKAGLEHTKELQTHLKEMGIPIDHPFWGSQCEHFPQVEQSVAQAREAVMTLKKSSEQLAQHLKLQAPDTREAVENMIRAARCALDAPELEGIAVAATEWLTRSDDLKVGLRAGERLSQLYQKYDNLLNKYDGDLIDETWLQTVLEIRRSLEALKNSSTQLAQHLKLQAPDTREAIESMIRVAHYALNAPELEGITVKATEWLERSEDLEVGLRAGERLSQLHEEYDDVLIPEAWECELLEVRKALAVYGPRWWRVFLGKYRRARNELAGLCSQQLDKNLDTQLRIVDAIREAQREQGYLEDIQELGKQLFGTHWQGDTSNWTQLQTITHYLSALHQLVNRNELPEELIDYFASNPDVELLRALVSTIEEDRNKHRITIASLEAEVQLPQSLEIQRRVVNTILEVKQIADAIIDTQRNFEGIQVLGKQLLGTHWQGDTSNWIQLQTIAQYLLVLHQSASMDELPEELIHHLESNLDFERLQTVISCLTAQRHTVNGITEIKQVIDEIIEMRQELEEFHELGKQLFGTHWQGDTSNWPQLQTITHYLSTLHQAVRQNELPEALVEYLASNPDLGILRSLVSTVEEHQNSHLHALQTVVEKIQLDETVRFGRGDELKARPFIEQVQILEHWERELEKLQDIVVYNGLAATLTDSGFAEIVKVASEWEEANQFLSDLLKHTWYSVKVNTAMRERILAQFSSATQQRVVERFRKLDKNSLQYNKAKVINKHRAHLPKHESSRGQLGVLLREFGNKKRSKKLKTKSIRQLMTEAGNPIQAIKPIFMMSPLSVAKFLPPDSVNFDWVIFDEASQVKPVDAYGAIIRGRQTIVVGDSCQLPPTDFFDKHVGDGDEDAEENPVDDMESILESFCAKRAPQRMLRWHYRSRHESLITVSNIEFYDNKLQLFPSPDAAKEEVGLVYHHRPDTIYDRGGSRKNREEARIVAERVMEHARLHSQLTLGVATFSTSQMEAVQDQLEILRRKDPSCEDTFFNEHPEEPFFVKNLENVQGDERDVIFISIGYGRDADGRLTMNFGPLNQDGGERRLNVLITRARRRCEVFTNLTADDINLRRTTEHDSDPPRGVVALKHYLEYAKTGKSKRITEGGKAGSPFEEAVADALRERGFQVDHQIGSAGYFIDLGVKDPERPGRYLLGIECDGATYHSAQSARDRDRLRQQVLEELGWRIHRIWSTDWFRNPGRELKKAVEAIGAAKTHIPSTPVHTPQNDIPNSNRGERQPEVKPDVIERSPSRPQRNSLIERCTEKYKAAELVIPTKGRDLHTVMRPIMAGWIQCVVKVESPVHLNEVTKRIANAVGVSRIGDRIRKAVKAAAQQASRSESIQMKGDFLYWTAQKQITVRDRSDLPNASRKLELIAPEEIETAIKQVVSDAFGIERNDLPREVCRLFGFGISKNMQQQINKVVDGMIKRKRLIQQEDTLKFDIPTTKP